MPDREPLPGIVVHSETDDATIVAISRMLSLSGLLDAGSVCGVTGNHVAGKRLVGHTVLYAGILKAFVKG